MIAVGKPGTGKTSSIKFAIDKVVSEIKNS